MRVLHLYSGNMYGGVETFLVTAARERRLAQPLEPHYGLSFGGRLRQELLAAGAVVHDLGAVRFRWPWTVWRARRRLRGLLDRLSPEVVVCHGSWPHAAYAPVVRKARLPLVFYVHGPIEVTWLDRLAARTPPDLIIGVSHHTLRTLPSIFQGVSQALLHYPMPWDETRFAAWDREVTRTEMGVPQGCAVILQASRMDPWKGHEDLLAALGRLRALPGWVYWQAGGPQRAAERRYYARLWRQVRALGLEDRVHFLGQRSDVPRLLAAADFYCQGNRGPEGFSLSFMEAFTAGLPIVTTDLGGAAELIDASSGILTAAGDVAALADGLRRLITDPALRRDMGRAAAQRVRQLSDPGRQLGRLRDLLTAEVTRARGGPEKVAGGLASEACTAP
jgi:glycosyltransferase involved in cell wall biosynthesis